MFAGVGTKGFNRFGIIPLGFELIVADSGYKGDFIFIPVLF